MSFVCERCADGLSPDDVDSEATYPDGELGGTDSKTGGHLCKGCSSHESKAKCPECDAKPLTLHAPGCVYTEEIIAGLQKDLERAQGTIASHQQQMYALQKYQKELPEPHRTAICNILANGVATNGNECD